MDEIAAISLFLLAALMAIVIARQFLRARPRPGDHVPAPDTSPGSVPAGDTSVSGMRIALLEAEHERDVSIARASEAEERERLARDRLGSLAPLEQRVEIAERRALDAERRLAEIAERVERDTDRVEGHAEGLRARLSRTAARKKRPSAWP